MQGHPEAGDYPDGPPEEDHDQRSGDACSSAKQQRAISACIIKRYAANARCCSVLTLEKRSLSTACFYQSREPLKDFYQMGSFSRTATPQSEMTKGGRGRAGMRGWTFWFWLFVCFIKRVCDMSSFVNEWVALKIHK